MLESQLRGNKAGRRKVFNAGEEIERLGSKSSTSEFEISEGKFFAPGE